MLSVGIFHPETSSKSKFSTRPSSVSALSGIFYDYRSVVSVVEIVSINTSLLSSAVFDTFWMLALMNLLSLPLPRLEISVFFNALALALVACEVIDSFSSSSLCFNFAFFYLLWLTEHYLVLGLLAKLLFAPLSVHHIYALPNAFTVGDSWILRAYVIVLICVVSLFPQSVFKGLLYVMYLTVCSDKKCWI